MTIKKQEKMHVKKGDFVEIITGKERFKPGHKRRGKILKIDTSKQKVVVEKLNMIKKHQKPSDKNKQGGILEVEGFIKSSNVLLVCPKCDKGVRTRKKFLEDDSKVRVCTKCGEILD